jgi:hypothetical protein
MNLFTRNSPYYHLLQYLLFLLKHPVYPVIEEVPIRVYNKLTRSLKYAKSQGVILNVFFYVYNTYTEIKASSNLTCLYLWMYRNFISSNSPKSAATFQMNGLFFL